jgi:nicotinate phosphoribosyltransferase
MIKRKDEPIILHAADIDFYKDTMGQLAFLMYPNVEVVYAFKNRTKSALLGRTIDQGQLREELDAAQAVRWSNSELHYLRGTNEYQERMFREEFLQFKKRLCMPGYHLEFNGDQFSLECPGKWPEAITWETRVLSIVNELHYRTLTKDYTQFDHDCVWATGILRLMEKIKILRQYPEITITEFGTRRRFSRAWQWKVIEVLAHELSPTQFLGTSNTRAAMEFDLVPMGTDAHESYMAMWGIMYGDDEKIRSSHNQHLQDWWNLYGQGLSIALTDTYGSEFFFCDMLEEQARKWKGLRHDSGDPIEFGERAIRFYDELGIDPREKMIIFSDGLDVHTIVKIYLHFKGRIKVTFGWGTDLTNDLGFVTLSMVVKLVESCGHGTVKLSDNLAKAIGLPEDIERAKSIFLYTGTHFQECRV